MHAPRTEIFTATRLRTMRFWLLIAANYIGYIGSVITLVAVPIYILQTTGSALYAGLAGTANTLPLALGGILGGAIVDRIGPRLAGAAAGFAGAAVMAALPLLHSTIGLPFALLLVFLFFRSLFDTPTVAARVSILATLAEDTEISKDTANALFQSGQRIALVAGPPVAALLIAHLGAITTLYLDAMAFALAAATLLLAAPAVSHRNAARAEPFFDQLLGGIRIIVNNTVLFSMVRIFIVTNLIDDAFAPVLLPVYARDVLRDPLEVSVPLVSFGIGAMVGTFAYIPITRIIPSRFSIFLGSMLFIALSRVALIAEPGAIGLAMLSLFVGFASGPLNPIITAIVQNAVAPEALGRTFGALMGIAFVAIPLGILLAGLLISFIGLRGTIAVYALCYVGITGYILVNKSLRTI